MGVVGMPPFNRKPVSFGFDKIIRGIFGGKMTRKKCMEIHGKITEKEAMEKEMARQGQA